MHPRGSVFAAEESSGFFVADDRVSFRVPVQGTSQLQRDVGKDAAGRRNVALFNVGNRLLTTLNALQKIQHVTADR